MYTVFSPQSTQLQGHILNINRLQPEALPTRYFAFPQHGATLAFLQNAHVHIDGQHLLIEPGQAPPTCLLLGKYLSPLEIHYSGPVEEISVNFSPTGTAYFFKDYFEHWASADQQVYTPEELDATPLFADPSGISIPAVEAYFNQKFINIDLNPIEEATVLIQQNPNVQTQEVATEVHLTEKTLRRNFKRYVGCTPSEYKRICKFRNAIQDSFQDTSKNLTQLGLDNAYYDSPHFYREIRKISSFKPKEFFQRVAQVGQEAYPYIFS